MSKQAVKVLRSVRIADGHPVYGRELVAGTQDEIPTALVATLEKEGVIELPKESAPTPKPPKANK